MPISKSDVDQALKDLQITYHNDGNHFVIATTGRHTAMIQTLLSVDEDSNGVTVISTLTDVVPEAKRAPVWELMNLVHGQSLWNFRLHLDNEGRVLALGKVMAWGRPFDAIQFGDVFFSVLVTTDRFSKCLTALLNEEATVSRAFEAFFQKRDERTEAAPTSEATLEE